MGGYGSGRRSGLSWTRTTDDCRRVSAGAWQRAGLLRVGTSFGWCWQRASDGAVQASITVDMLVETAMRLRYTLRPHGDEAEDVQYIVPLTWTPCRFGGRRPWFLCPGERQGRACARRVAQLYLGRRYFLCRHCLGLGYASQRQLAAERALHRAQRIRQRLGGSASLLEPFPEKPKGMHWRTYDRLLAAALAGEEQWLAHSDALLARLAGVTP